METTTVREFRQKLSSWFGKAKEEPVFISRKEERFVMISEETFFEMKDTIDELKTALIAELTDEESLTLDDVFKSDRKEQKAL